MSLSEIIILALIAFYIIVMACFRLEPRVTIAVALALLIATAITLVWGMRSLADKLASYAFYFLVATVVLLFIDYIREEPKGGS